MNNMRRGFTMIELIFVIVIIGILAAVAIPKLAGTANEARKSTIKGFLGTLNRSTGPAMWSTAVNIPAPDTGTVTGYALANYTDIPNGVVMDGDLAACGKYVAPVDDPATPLVDESTIPNPAGYALIATITSLPEPESLYCLDGTATDSPKFAFDENGTQEFVNNP